jgi:hypothetical protein
MLYQHPERVSRDATDAEPISLGEFGEEVLDQDGNVISPGPERRHIEHAATQPVIEVLTECPALDRRFEISMRRSLMHIATQVASPQRMRSTAGWYSRVILPCCRDLDDRVDSADACVEELIALNHVWRSLVDADFLQRLVQLATWEVSVRKSKLVDAEQRAHGGVGCVCTNLGSAPTLAAQA